MRGLAVRRHLVEDEVLERTCIRCPVCRSVVPMAAVWATGDSCPRCLARLDTEAIRNDQASRAPVRPVKGLPDSPDGRALRSSSL